MTNQFHTLKEKEVFDELKASDAGLTHEEVEQRLAEYGHNVIKEAKKISPLKIFVNQFHSAVVYILFAAVIISVFLHEIKDAVVIGIILLINGIIGFWQEYSAQKSIDALKKLASPQAVVLRDGKDTHVDAKDIVPGDVLVLTEGDKLPADARVLHSINLQTQEAALTGESTPIKKEVTVLKEKTALADRVNMVYNGTIVTSGKGKAIVTGTGMQSEIGKIAKLIQETEDEPTPLQEKLGKLGKHLGIATIMISIIVFAAGFFSGGDMLEFFIIAVALAVAAIPEGLPIVVTITLSIGSRRMVKKNALVRQLASVESLGSTTVICTDKTGTLTKNEMTVKRIYANGKIINVSGSGYEVKGNFTVDGKAIDPRQIDMLLTIGTVNNDASIENKQVVGDPTEASLLVSAAKAGYEKTTLQTAFKRVDEIPFSSERKIMTTVHDHERHTMAFTKGAPEKVLNLCTSILENGKVKKLTSAKKQEILKVNETFAKSALRVLGFAYKEVMSKERMEKGLTFVGLQAMIDPPRLEVKDAIKQCEQAGIKVVMITGDHEITAKAIGKAIGLEGQSMTGAELEKVEHLEKQVEDIVIYARVNPEHKLKIVEALQKKGHIVAMTGDGVNDAPALKKADIGIAMGITGTEVSKEASDMILTDDNFSSIVNAVDEGRTIYDNIKKFVEYLLSSNLGEVLTIFIAIFIFAAHDGASLLPLIPIMLLWINLTTDSPPALALAIDPPDPHNMKRPPRNPKERIISIPIIARMIIVGITMMAGTLWVFNRYDPVGNIIYAQTMAFTTLMMFQMFNVINCRSEFKSIFRVGPHTNPQLLLAILLSVILQIVVIHTPLSQFFGTIPITGFDWFLATAVASSVWIIVEIYKFFIVKAMPQLDP